MPEPSSTPSSPGQGQSQGDDPLVNFLSHLAGRMDEISERQKAHDGLFEQIVKAVRPQQTVVGGSEPPPSTPPAAGAPPTTPPAAPKRRSGAGLFW